MFYPITELFYKQFGTTVEKVHMEASKVGVTQVGDRQLFHSLRWSTKHLSLYVLPVLHIPHMFFLLLSFHLSYLTDVRPFFHCSFIGSDASLPKYNVGISRTSVRNPLARNPYSYLDDVARLALEIHKVFIIPNKSVQSGHGSIFLQNIINRFWPTKFHETQSHYIGGAWMLRNYTESSSESI